MSAKWSQLAYTIIVAVTVIVAVISLTLTVTVQYGSLLGPYGPWVEFDENTNTVEVTAFVTARLDQILIEYDANSGVVAPRGCHYDVVNLKVVTIICGTHFGRNLIQLDSNRPFWAAARLTTGRRFFLPTREFLPPPN